MNEAGALQFVMDAFGHLKAIGASKAAKPLLDKAGVAPDDGVIGLGKDFIEAARRRLRRWPGRRLQPPSPARSWPHPRRWPPCPRPPGSWRQGRTPWPGSVPYVRAC